ncbi:hypothetical protein M0R45_007252 [Rubus argutus]|uniref:Uncharacterized protein n=1 Tax=Rubus argutus TaxID=59490 RepID=A0AAW1Y0K8_RUBAR
MVKEISASARQNARNGKVRKPHSMNSLMQQIHVFSTVTYNDLAKRLDEETNLCTRYHNRVSEYKEKCRVLEEDKNNLTAKLAAAIALSELYRSMLHDLAS